MKKKCLIFNLLVFIVLLFSISLSFEVKAASSSGLSFQIERVIELGDYKSISIKAKNNTNQEYSFGWVSSCDFNVQ